MNMIILTPVCPICGKEHNVAIENEEGFYKWNALFEEPQKALPELTVEEREALISQMCKTCQREIFALSFCEEGIETDDYLDSVYVKCGDYARFARIADTIGTFKEVLKAKNIRFERIEKDVYIVYDADAKDVNRKGIRGDFLIVKKTDGRFVSLSEKEVTKYLHIFNRPVLENINWSIDDDGTLFVYCDEALIAEVSDVSEEMAETIVSEVIEESFYINNNYSKEAIQEWLKGTK